MKTGTVVNTLLNVDFTVNEAQYTRQLVLNFHDSATAGFDYGLELIRNESSTSDAYFSLDERYDEFVRYNGHISNLPL